MSSVAKLMRMILGAKIEISLHDLILLFQENDKHLPFHPTVAVDETPRYLFRVFTPDSQGESGIHWVKSMAASDSLPCSMIDVFSIIDKQRAADLLARHLRWRKIPNGNLVSWTSSLLFALVYIFHLRASIHNEATLDEIQLLVVDTAGLPKGAFMRDLDLMRAFRSFDLNLRNVEDLRYRQSSEFLGYYYFGEYLSQGALKVEGHCQMVSARNLVDGGLYDIRKEFKEFANWKQGPGSARWANAVIQMREIFYLNQSQRSELSKRAILAVLQISRQFEPNFQAPIAANLIAIAAPRYYNVPTLFICRELPAFTVFDWEQFFEEAARMVACETTPEVQEYNAVMRVIYEESPKPTVATTEETIIKTFGPIYIMDRT
ncbi:hypothetical protein A0O28_0064440 [Trichoderma guizhouense]|uniref:DUF7587 domain-containing protein n=1 Tax=Trichoderma guizhouense TaxID=1491466 RepID=A0A1T3CZ06_9HYPO|nr:hypothetical protein A0O28_0064440 [Trichoderma guizhouense]